MNKEQLYFFTKLIDLLPYPAFVSETTGKIVLKNKEAELFVKSHVGEFFIDEQTVNGKLLTEGNGTVSVLRGIRYSDENGEYVFFLANEEGRKGTDVLDSERILEFLGDVSHELRTPLNGIVGFAELMLKKSLSLEKIRDYVQIIYSNGIFMQQLIGDILDFAKIETGHFKLRKNYFSINRLIYDLMVIFLTDLQIRRKEHISLLFNNGLADGADMIVADEIRLKQVFVNLISNAIKFTEKGSVMIGYTVKGDFLEFYVKDTGIGIEKEALEHIFDRYIQANRKISATYGGSGIGLSIARDIITMHGGRIWAESELGVGTTFYFTLPYEKELAR